MSIFITVLLILIILVFLMMTIPRIIMTITTAKLKNKAAPGDNGRISTRIKSGEKAILYFYTPA